MKNLTNFKEMNIFFVGIGGISMSGLAKITHKLGAFVSGSDIQNVYLPELNNLGVNVYLGHNGSHITEDIDLVVFSGAIGMDNPELIRAKELNINIMERSEYLGYISKLFKEVIMISGCHGKTTVSSMIGHIFEVAKLSPTVHIGGESLNFKSNTKIGGDKYFIVEGCEYRESFLFTKPQTGVILNIDKDHLDYYKNYDNICNAFSKFANSSDKLFVNKDYSFIHKNGLNVYKYYSVDKIKTTLKGYKYKVYYNNKYLMTVNINIIGRHNIENSLFAIAVSRNYGISKKIIKKALASYLGVKRRYEIIGEYLETPIISDYAHHPNEIKKSINGIKERFYNPLIIFQPHTYSRTESLKDEFVESLNENDVIIYPTYPAREKYSSKGSAYNLYRKLKNKHKFYVKDIKKLKCTMQELLLKNKYDIVVILGAGDLYDKFNEIL